MERESFKSRLGFLLISAGCAIGVGNVWRFPYVAGNSGGGIFVLFYLFFLIVMGVPILTMEFAIGRKSRKSVVTCFQEIEQPGQKWHVFGKLALIGNYVLMFFYTTVAGWMLNYFLKFLTGTIESATPEASAESFALMLSSPGELMLWMLVVTVVSFAVCSLGLQKGVEKITKVMMIALLLLISVLAIHSLTLEGGMEGLSFYLKPDLNKMKEVGTVNVIVAAMNQSFFTLSIGIGSMAIFGSYMKKDHTLLGESVQIVILDTFVAIVAGLIIFPACFAFGVKPDVGPSLIFVTLPNVFHAMSGGRIWGTLFFLFMTFASASTLIAVFENIIACCMEIFHIERKKAAWLNCAFIIIGSIPCVLGFNLLSGFTPFGAGSNVLDLEDFIVSNLLLPIGSLIFLIFCVSKRGWGFDGYRAEVNEGKGIKMPAWIRGYVTYVLPLLIIVLLIMGLIDKFA